jgi:hypothetical protein
LTTCALDYVTWANDLPAGEETINRVKVRRFPVSRPRNTKDFGRRSLFVFDQPHSVADELAWLESEGPTSPALVSHLRNPGIGESVANVLNRGNARLRSSATILIRKLPNDTPRNPISGSTDAGPLIERDCAENPFNYFGGGGDSPVPHADKADF